MKILKIVVVLLVLLVVALVLGRNVAIKSAAQQAIKQATGFDLEVGSVRVGLVKPEFEINELKLINPEDFPERGAFEVRQVKVAYDFLSLFSDNIRLREVVVDIPEAVVVKKADGETNLQRLSAVARKEKKTGEKEPAAEPPAEPPAPAEAGKPAKKIRIDLLTLKLGTVRVRDYSKNEDKPEELTYNLNVNQQFQNVTDIKTVGIMITAMIVQNVGTRVISDVSKIVQENYRPIDVGKQIDKIGSAFKGLLQGSGGEAPRPKTP